MLVDYKIIQPPFPLRFREMSRVQANEYLNWFIDQIPVRINELSQYIHSSTNGNDWISDFSPSSLDELGKWFCKNVETRKRSEKEIENIYASSSPWFRTIQIPDKDLSNKTISLCIDIGMYLSKVMERNLQGLHWEIVTKPKNDVYFQQPVLVGKGKLVFNPVHLIITYAYGISRGTKGPERLKELYEIWFNILGDDE